MFNPLPKSILLTEVEGNLHVKVIAVQVIVVVIIVVIVIIVVVDVYLRTLSMQVVGEKTLSTVVVSAPVWKCFEKSTNSPH